MPTTYKWNHLTRRQQDAARELSDRYGNTVSQTARYLDQYMALSRGEISPREVAEITGHLPTT